MLINYESLKKKYFNLFEGNEEYFNFIITDVLFAYSEISKIFENSAMQIPVLLGVEGESAEIIKQYNAGLCFEPENRDDFIKNLNLLRDDEQVYKNCQTGCLELAKAFDRKKMAFKMRSFLLDIIEK